jgi:hypothetical protein
VAFKVIVASERLGFTANNVTWMTLLTLLSKEESVAQKKIKVCKRLLTLDPKFVGG